MQINHQVFFTGYRKHFGRLQQSQVDALDALLVFLEGDEDIEEIEQAAYILATIKHECANTYRPIEEYGKGKGRPYGKADAKTGKVYFGRGFVQLTWKRNYQTFADLLDIDLVNRPELALNPQVAWQITSAGMREGLFTGKALSNYISGDKRDYRNARRIINGTDQAAKIAGYAESFEDILRAATVQAMQQSEPVASFSSSNGDATQPLESPTDAPQQTNESGGSGQQVVIQPNALQPTEAAKPIVSQKDEEPQQATTGGFKSAITSVVGWLTGAGAGLVALLKDNQTLLIIAAIIAVIAGLAYFIRQLILDRDRLRIASDPTKYNSK